MRKLLFILLSAGFSLPTFANSGPQLCTALRGNGYKLPVTLAGVARTSEEFGVSDIVLGSSSGSIAAFMHENILSNPVIRDCNGNICSQEELGMRVSTAIKSMLGYTEYLKGDTKGGRLAMNIALKLENGDSAGIVDVFKIFMTENLRKMFNMKSIFPSAATILPWNWKKQFIKSKGAFSAANFSVDDEDEVAFEVMIREGALNLPFALNLIGRAGDFYSNLGVDQTTKWKEFFNQCTPKKKGVYWPKMSEKNMNNQETCASHFHKMITDFMERSYPRTRHKAYVGGKKKVRYKRIIAPASLNKVIGKSGQSIVTTSFFKGKNHYDEFNETKRKYDRQRNVDLSRRDWIQDFHIAYFGNNQTVERISKNKMGFTDLKTRSMYPAGEITWFEGMLRSVSEPGLATAFPFKTGSGDHGVTAGGWVDNHGTLALKNAGCEKVIYITRQGTDSNYASAVAYKFGADQPFIDNLFGHGNSQSFGESLKSADALLCTDWDSFEGIMNPVGLMAQHGYDSPIVTEDNWFIEQASKNLNLELKSDKPGCMTPAHK